MLCNLKIENKIRNISTTTETSKNTWHWIIQIANVWALRRDSFCSVWELKGGVKKTEISFSEKFYHRKFVIGAYLKTKRKIIQTGQDLLIAHLTYLSCKGSYKTLINHKNSKHLPLLNCVFFKTYFCVALVYVEAFA